MTKFCVNYSELSGLARQLQTVVDGLGDIVDTSWRYDGDLGHTQLQGALHQFAKDWEGEMKDVREEARSLAKALKNTATSYRTADKELAAQFRRAAK